MAATTFQLVTWYDTWNLTGLQNLQNKLVPLNYATRYNLAFGQLSPVASNIGYSIEMTGQYAADVNAQLRAQAPGVIIFAGLGNTGVADTVEDNNQYQNRSTKNIVTWLKANAYNGISIDAEEPDGMAAVAEFVTQLGPAFKAAGLGIAVSAPWPGGGPVNLYGNNAVKAFNDNVMAIELQDYSSDSTPNDAPVWVKAGIKSSILLGGVSTENGNVQTSLADTQVWTQYVMANKLGGMFSWRLDNDHGLDGQNEDQDPTFTGAKMIYDTVNNNQVK